MCRQNRCKVQDVVSAHHDFTNVATNVPHLSVDKPVYVYRDELSEYGRKRMVWPEHNSVMLMKYIMLKFFKPGQLVLDLLEGSLLQLLRAYCWTTIGGSLDAKSM